MQTRGYFINEKFPQCCYAFNPSLIDARQARNAHFCKRPHRKTKISAETRHRGDSKHQTYDNIKLGRTRRNRLLFIKRGKFRADVDFR